MIPGIRRRRGGPEELFAQRIFGTDRRSYLVSPGTDLPRQRAEDPRAAALRQEINGLHQAETNLMAQIEAFQPTGDDEIDNEWRKGLQQRFADVVKTRRINDLVQATTALPTGG